METGLLSAVMQDALEQDSFALAWCMNGKGASCAARSAGRGAGRGMPVSAASGDSSDDGDTGPGTGLATRVKPKVKKPDLYRVLLLNDDFTPMEFVVHILQRFFRKTPEQATRIMLHVHNNGVGECGVFTYEVAETKVTQVMDFARKHQHPLQCVMEKK